MSATNARLLGLMLLFVIGGCVEDPTVANPPYVDEIEHGVIVVNEGLWYQDNATLTLFDPASGVAVQDFFARRNPGQRLGDIGNAIVVRDDQAFIVVSTSQNIEVIALPSGRSEGRVRIGAGDPRKLAILDDSTAYVTLVKADAVARFDPRTLAVTATLPVGPAPEGVAAAAGRLFVANSGYGFLRRDEPKAGTVSVLAAATGAEQTLLHPGPNPVGAVADTARGVIYILYGMPHADSLGGVVAYDARTLRETGRWVVKGAGVAGEMALDAGRRLLYVIDGTGAIARIDAAATATATRFGSPSAPSALGFYGIGVSPVDGSVYASYVTSYSLPGAVVVHDAGGAVRARFDAGLNPATFGFF